MGSVLHHNSGIVIPRDEYEELTEALATVFRIGAKFTPRLIERLDLADGDPDLEDDADAEQASWGNAPSQLGLHGHCMAWHHDDAEEDDPAGQYDEDAYTARKVPADGPGCPIADPGGCEHDGREPDEGI
ncbi:MAG: hypothetical protein QNI87_12060 [Erythrobacter sp.]|uniref:hypothetical protein n=1 Tax=Erythrobacter sp. TaxID=1042 RepID=UPI00262AAC4C|nr:hypothetical protein [Erythrobacter sp.]MDJ0979251.1 hypothetical protein [Erythrobacter sp.]